MKTNVLKVCSKCSLERDLGEFYKNRPECKDCTNTKQRMYAQRKLAEDADGFLSSRRRAAMKYTLREKFGMSEAEYDERLMAQGYACAICGRTDAGTTRTDRLLVDHDHTTGKVRGLLCDPCNVGLGRFNDDPASLIAAAAYLIRGESD